MGLFLNNSTFGTNDAFLGLCVNMIDIAHNCDIALLSNRSITGKTR